MRLLPYELLINILVITLVILSLGLFLFLIFFLITVLRRLLSSMKKTRGRSAKENAYMEAEAILDDARAKALKILKDSNEKARGTLRSAHTMTDDSERKLESELEALSKEHSGVLADMNTSLLNFYRQTMTKQKDESMRIIEQSSKDLETTLQKETAESHAQVKEKIGEEFDVLENELKAYREQKMGEIDGSIYDILYEVSKEVLGKAIDLEDHEELVIKALEDAKKKSLFK